MARCRSLLHAIAALSFAAIVPSMLPRTALAGPVGNVRLEIQVPSAQARRGGGTPINVVARIEPGWHINAHEPLQTYLIPSELTFSLPTGVSTDPIGYPAPVEKSLTFAPGERLRLYEGSVHFETRLHVPGDFAGDRVEVTAALRYQACNDATCLRPATVRTERSIAMAQALAPAGVPAGTPVRAPAAGHAEGQIERWLRDRGLALTLLAVVVLGLGLNLTPCVYPLISVTIAYFGSQGRHRSQTIFLAGLYVLGIALSFSVVGVAAGLSGGLFGSLLQRPVVVLALTALMVILALGSFGVYQFQPPVALLRWIGRSSTGVAGALFMGLTMGIVAAPCVGPIVSGLLVFVGTRGDPYLGFVLFFALALGMGLPYIALAAVAGGLKHLPRSGEWLVWTEHFFGCILLALAAYFISPILPEPLRSHLLAVVVGLGGVYLGFIERSGRTIRLFPLTKRLVGTAMILASVWLWRHDGMQSPLTWEVLASVPADGRLPAADRPAVLDFSADWCIPCREMERTTYVDPEVVNEVRRFRMIKVDLTEDTPKTADLVARFSVQGVPTVLLISRDGAEVRRLVGYVGPADFLAALREVR